MKIFLTFFLSKLILFILPPLICVAFITLLERKVLSLVGFRLGPNKVSFIGVLQPLGDALKLSGKSVNSLMSFTFFLYYFSSLMMISMSVILFSSLNSSPSFVSFCYPLLLVLLVLGINSLNSIFCGWSAYSKFSLIGSLRTVAQLVSYEGVLYLCLFFFILLTNCFDFDSFSFSPLYLSFLPLMMVFLFWIPTVLAELNRTPYDFSEGESELVSGFNTEFSSGCFTLIFLAEYGMIIFFSVLSSLFFFDPIYFFPFLFFFFFIWIRSVLPRFRFDKLMLTSWKFFIPFLTLFLLLFFCYFI